MAPTVAPAHGGEEFLEGLLLGIEQFAVFWMKENWFERKNWGCTQLRSAAISLVAGAEGYLVVVNIDLAEGSKLASKPPRAKGKINPDGGPSLWMFLEIKDQRLSAHDPEKKCLAGSALLRTR